MQMYVYKDNRLLYLSVAICLGFLQIDWTRHIYSGFPRRSLISLEVHD